jgi:hypothetical protein
MSLVIFDSDNDDLVMLIQKLRRSRSAKFKIWRTSVVGFDAPSLAAPRLAKPLRMS